MIVTDGDRGGTAANKPPDGTTADKSEAKPPVTAASLP